MVITKYGTYESVGENHKKTKIILTHTSRNLDEYLISIKYRLPDIYRKVPNYIISRDGVILKLLEDYQYSNTLSDEALNKDSIIITLENLGWLEKIPLTNHYINWLGNIYNKPAFEKKWRDYFYWEPYNNIQVENLKELCLEICKNNSIPFQSVGHNVKIKGVGEYSGIMCRANYDYQSTDLNPSFDFKIFNTK